MAIAGNKHVQSGSMNSGSLKFLTDHVLPLQKVGLIVGIRCIVLVPLDGAGTQLGGCLNIPLNDPRLRDAHDRLELNVGLRVVGQNVGYYGLDACVVTGVVRDQP